MKKILLLLLIFSSLFGNAQIDFAKQIKKKDFDEITFKSITNTNGDVIHGFFMNNLAVGPYMLKRADGTLEYKNYNRKHQIDGSMITFNQLNATVTLQNYRKGAPEGGAFQLKNGNIVWAKTFKNGTSIEDNLGMYREKKANAANCIGDCLNGFGIKKNTKINSITIGFFAFESVKYPALATYSDNGQYFGQFILGIREQFGVYIFPSGRKYIGFWKKGDQEGYGFYLDKEGQVEEKGYYKNGSLAMSM